MDYDAAGHILQPRESTKAEKNPDSDCVEEFMEHWRTTSRLTAAF
jgi:hypothetical protein